MTHVGMGRIWMWPAWYSPHPCISLAGQDILVLSAGECCRKGASLWNICLSWGVPGGQEWEHLAHGRGFICMSLKPLFASYSHPSSHWIGKVKWVLLWIHCSFWVVFTTCSVPVHLEVARMPPAPVSSSPGLFGSKSQISYQFYL